MVVVMTQKVMGSRKIQGTENLAALIVVLESAFHVALIGRAVNGSERRLSHDTRI